MKALVMLIAMFSMSIASAQQVQSHQRELSNGLIEINPGFSNGECVENDAAHRVSVHMLNGEVSRRVLTTRYFLQPDDYTIVGEDYYNELAAILGRADGTYAPTGERVPDTPSGRIGVIVPAGVGSFAITGNGENYLAVNGIALSDGTTLHWIRTTDIGDHLVYSGTPDRTRFTITYCGEYRPE